MVACACPPSVQSPGLPGLPCSSRTTGSTGRGRANHTGGRYTSASRAAKPDTVPGSVTETTAPAAGTAPSAAAASESDSSSGTGPPNASPSVR